MINLIKAMICNKTLVCTCFVVGGLLALYGSVLRVDAAAVVPQSSLGLQNLMPTPQIMTHRETQPGYMYNQGGSAISSGTVIGYQRGNYWTPSSNVANCGNAPNSMIGAFGSIDRSDFFYSLYAGENYILNLIGMQYIEMGCDATWGTCNGVTRTQPPRWLVDPNLYDYQCRMIPGDVNWRAPKPEDR